jgi:spore maturation protein CgeB
MKIVIFGLTITSAWGNGHATTFRSLLKALARRGHHVEFIEKNVEWYKNNRDLPKPEYCKLRLYKDWKSSRRALIQMCSDADAVIIGSYFPDAIDATKAIVEADFGPIFFYDIDTPITLAGLRANGGVEYLDAASIPHYDAYLSFTGGPALKELEQCFGARQAIPFYCSVDPDLYQRSSLREGFRVDLSYLGTYASDRQPKLMRLLNEPAALLPSHPFLVAGAMYPDDITWQPNVSRITHVSPPDHPAFYSSARFTLNLTREDMVAAGYSPSVRLFEASACGAAILSDDWEGLDEFLTPGEQILLPRDEHDVADILLHLSDAERRKIGNSARERIFADHTSMHRASQFEDIVSSIGNHPTKRETVPRMSSGKDPVFPLEVVPASTHRSLARSPAIHSPVQQARPRECLPQRRS